MMPGGHLATSVVLSASAYAYTQSLEAAAGCFLGGFLIDVDHYLDYILFEGQWRRPGPASFLRYYFRLLPERLVLPLHSIELMILLTAVSLIRPNDILAGYLAGALMHLIFDIIVNGDHVLKRRVLFYSFIYRASQRFAAKNLLDPITIPAKTGSHPYREFFKWRPPEEKV